MRKIKTKIGTMYYDNETSKYFNYYDSDKRWLGCITARPYKEIGKIKHIADLTNNLFEFMAYAQSKNDLLEETNRVLEEYNEERFDSFKQIEENTYKFGIYGRIGKNYFLANFLD